MTDYLLEISFDDPALEEIIQSRLFLTASSGSTSTDDAITAYFDSAADRDAARDALADLDGIRLSAYERERVDWLEVYEQSLEPIAIGQRFLVAPDAKLLRDTHGRVPMIVPQEQAFGTGSHETTALCIELLETLRGITNCLDIGTGSGILALAMYFLGARKVIAFDNDPDAFGAMRDNRIRNHVREERMPLFIGGIEALRGGVFDVVTMNIIPEVIVPLLPQVVTHVGGALILSGILAIRRDDVVAAASENALTLASERRRGEWWAGLFYAR